ncbi:tripartite-type tricarboxylate transporter receptor subunit TctC [Anaerosolibacter carboniphilus]|uniref:Tripartite-type tricarboxylate transporter receptor subunit TctC n=1 Tax=Anaerosolibacter carboniphilus TaxID=1417629 RepID=A0A841KZ16_9FIRM|nr:tripartite tricarboxylate transporter substrate binding protein [Anaerosolibacter carboniphilus]MBB6218573.1 tripartite-type tricarboxylate transporter receptor subunit TctC [Anaerosolibacter carboniphilus]
MLSMKKVRVLSIALVILMLALMATGCSSPTGSQGGSEESKVKFPEKPVNLVVWGSPGGGSDIFGRTLAKAAEPILGKPVVVENKPGGGGATAMAYMAGQKADGYATLAVTTNLVLTPLTKGTPNTYQDFDPIIMVGRDATMAAVKADGYLQSIEDVVKAGKERRLKWGTFGIGTTDHVAAAIFQKQTGIQVDFVPFDGGGEAMAALLGGHIDVLNGNPSEIAGQLEAGQLKGIGVFSPERLEDYKDVPTFKENGQEIIVETWRGIVAPKGTPEEVKTVMYEAFKKALDDPAMVDYYKKNNIIKDAKNGQEFYSFIEEQNEFYKKTLTEMGIIK